ncbi:MAG: isoprenylcysteine carboxylmethyltransferase family protein [Bacteroidota bacterium]
MDLRKVLFTYRSYTPIPFLVVMVLWAHPTLGSLLGGFSLALFGETLRFWGVSIAGSETRTTGTVGASRLIVGGPFAYVRNPLYLGNIILYCGIGIMANTLLPWLLIIAFVYFVFQYLMIVSSEEEYLAQNFGEEYTEYMRNVPRFIPRFVPWVSEQQKGQSADIQRGLQSERRTLQAVALITLLLILIGLLRGGA